MSKGIFDLSAEDIMYSRDVDARIAGLEQEITALLTPDPGDGSPEIDEAAELDAELTELKEFRDTVTRSPAGDGWDRDRGMSFINVRYWDQYASEQAGEIYGEATSTEFWDGGKWSARLQRDFAEVRLNGDVFLYDGR
jgi:hypothetical protein